MLKQEKTFTNTPLITQSEKRFCNVPRNATLKVKKSKKKMAGNYLFVRCCCVCCCNTHFSHKRVGGKKCFFTCQTALNDWGMTVIVVKCK